MYMQTLEAIFKRRSIRKFTEQKIKDDDIKTLLRAAMMAPTARNAQEWEFIVIRSKETFAKIMEVHPYASMLQQADAAIAVCANLSKEHIPGYWVGDCGAATQNILLAATELGIGSVWLGVQAVKERRDGIKKVLNLPDGIEPFCIIALGYPGEARDQADRYDKAKVHHENW